MTIEHENEHGDGPFDGRFERRINYPILTEVEIEHIAERAAEKALIKIETQQYKDYIADEAAKRMEAKLYQSVGKTFINRLFQFIGSILIGLALYLHHKGFLKVE